MSTDTKHPIFSFIIDSTCGDFYIRNSFYVMFRKLGITIKYLLEDIVKKIKV